MFGTGWLLLLWSMRCAVSSEGRQDPLVHSEQATMPRQAGQISSEIRRFFSAAEPACLPARAGIMDGWYILDPERQQIIRAMTAGEGDAGRGRRDGEAGGGAPRARASCSRLAIASACVSAWHPPPPASVRARLGLRALMLPA